MKIKAVKTVMIFLFTALLVVSFSAEARKKKSVTPPLAKTNASADDATKNEKADADTAEKSTLEAIEPVTAQPTVENKMIDTLLENGGFPAKSDYLSAEEGKAEGAEPSGKPIVLTPAMPALGPSGKDIPAPSYSKFFLAFLFVVAMIAALALLWRKIEAKVGGILPKSMAGSGKSLRIIAQQPINLKSKVLIIEALGKRYLVGATQDHIQLLADLDFFDAKTEAAALEEPVAEVMPVEQPPTVSNLQTVMEPRVPVMAPKVEARGVFTPLIREPQKQEVSSNFDAVLEQEQASLPRVAERIREKLKSMKKISSTH